MIGHHLTIILYRNLKSNKYLLLDHSLLGHVTVVLCHRSMALVSIKLERGTCPGDVTSAFQDLPPRPYKAAMPEGQIRSLSDSSTLLHMAG